MINQKHPIILSIIDIKSIVLIGLFVSVNAVFANDSSACSGKYDNDSLKHGVWVCRLNDKITIREIYKHGKLISYIKFDGKGDIIETRNKNGVVKKSKSCGC